MMIKRPHHSKIMKEIIEHFGTQTNLAEKLGVTLQYVNAWMCGRQKMPMIHAFKIEKLSKGKFKAIDLIDKELRKYI